MLRLVVQRLIQSIPLVFGATIVLFIVLRVMPGADPAELILGPKESPEAYAAARKEFDLDKPLPIQYLVWLKHIVQGDLGHSYLTHVPVSELLEQRIPATLELTFAAMFLAIGVSVPAGALAALNRGGKFDLFMTWMATVFMSLPGFWLGILLIFVFSQHLRVLPPAGRVDLFSSPFEELKHLAMPAITLALYAIASMSRLVKATVLEVLHEDYVRTARAKGLSATAIVRRHIMPNAFVPVLTLMGLWFGRLLGGAVITESIFTWPGLGRLVLSSIQSRDYAVVQGAMLYFVLIFIFINFITDVAYGIIDPRIRLGSQARN
jgi:ABC-type dipeptide/oligopeptide/nickel transport system permease component